MWSDLERRLAQALSDGAPTPEATGWARQAVLATVATSRPRRRVGWLGGGLMAAATITAGAGMAATGHLVPGSQAPTAAPPSLVVTGSRPGAVTLDNGRAWVATAAGARHSRPASAVELSPAGLFIAFGSRGALAAAELEGATRWRVAVRGEVVQIAWAPYPTYIAYVVRRGSQHDLRVIWANGRNDRLVARDVAPVRPRWAADTGALFYESRDGQAWRWDREPDRLRPGRERATPSPAAGARRP